jgi:hypothetical protein
MILDRTAIVKSNDLSRLSWSRLGHFQHTETVEHTLIRVHQIEKQHYKNARKQAINIRDCIRQATEYRDAASATTLATRPTLLYYAAMNLAWTEILFKGTGASSLDKLREEHCCRPLSSGQRLPA